MDVLPCLWITLGDHMHVGQHPRERSALCPYLPILHRHGDACAPRACRPLQSVFSCLCIIRSIDHASIPIRAYTSPRPRPRHPSQRLHRERAQPLYKATPGNSPKDIFPRPRRRGQWENGGGQRRRRQRGSRIATSSSGTTYAAPDGSRTAKVGLAYFLFLDSST